MDYTAFLSRMTPTEQRRFTTLAGAYGTAYDKGRNCTDPRILGLPHHKRITQNNALALEAEFMGTYAPAVMAESMRSGATRQDIARVMLEQYPDLAHGIFRGRMDVLCDIGLRLMVFNKRVRFFQTTNALESMLLDSDFGKDIPAEWFRTPYDEIYIEFGETRTFPTRMHDPVSGEHVIEGCYLLSGMARSWHSDTLVRGYDIIFFGSPIGKHGVMDDCFTHLGLPICDDRMSIAELVRETVEHYQARSHFPNAMAVGPVIEHVAKILVYLGTRDARCQAIHAGRDALQKIALLKSPAKREKAARIAARQYDRVLVGPDTRTQGMAHGTADGGAHEVRPHIRRGHFRAQPYGSRHSLRRPQWIQPTLIGMGGAAGCPEQPEYIVR